MPEHVTLLLFDEHRRERRDVDINARLTSVQYSTAVNRGFDELRIGIEPQRRADREDVQYGQLPDPVDMQTFSRAELYIGNYLAFEGRLMPTSVPADAFVVRGYWSALASDDWFASTDTTTDTSGNVIKGMLSSSLLPIRPGSRDQFDDPLSQHAPAEFDGRTIADALALVVNEGDALGHSVDWYVWDARTLHLKSRRAPSQPNYRLPLDPSIMTIICDPSGMLSGLVIEYSITDSGSATITSGNTSVTVSHDLGVTPADTDIRFVATNNPTNDPGNSWIDTIGASSFQINVRNDPGTSGASFAWFIEVDGQRTDEASNAEFYREFGFQRRRLTSAGRMSQAAAERIRDRLIKDAQRPRYSVKVRLEGNDYLPGPHGEPQAKWIARAGQWAQIADLPMLMAVETSYDVTGDVLEIEFGERLPTLDDQLRRLTRAEERRSRGLQPATGGAIP